MHFLYYSTGYENSTELMLPQDSDHDIMSMKVECEDGRRGRGGSEDGKWSGRSNGREGGMGGGGICGRTCGDI